MSYKTNIADGTNKEEMKRKMGDETRVQSVKYACVLREVHEIEV
jgi:hypothetical protein